MTAGKEGFVTTNTSVVSSEEQSRDLVRKASESAVHVSMTKTLHWNLINN